MNTSGRPRLAAFLPWVLLAALALTGTAIGPAGWAETLAYQAYAVVAVALPGLVTKRLLAGPASLLEDLGIGFALGTTGQLVLWAVHQWLGGPAWLMWSGPAAVLALLAVPAVRRRVRGGSPAPVWFHWTLASLTGLGLLSLWTPSYLLSPPLAQSRQVYQDFWYHLALNTEMLRAFPLVSPDAVGVPLTYHWYSNAFMAAGHLMTGVDLYSILMRQWLVPMFIGCMLGTVAVARQVSGSWHVAWLAPALAFALPGSFRTYGWPQAPSTLGFIPESPSTLIGLVMLLAGAALALQLWRSSTSWPSAAGVWVALVIVIAGGTGSKPAVLPLLGCLAAGWVVASLFRRDRGLLGRVSWNGLAVGLAVVAATVLSSGIVSDDAQSGSALQLGGFLRFIPGFTQLAGVPWTQPGTYGAINPAILAGGRQTKAVGIAVGWLVLVQAWHWLPAVALPARRLRGNPAAWSLLAAVAGAWAVFAIVDHPGFSEVYFPITVIPLAAVLASWVVVEMAAASRGALVSVLAAAAATLMVVAVMWRPMSPQVPSGSHFFDLAKAVIVVVLVCAAIWSVQRLMVKESARRASVVSLILAGMLAGSLALPARDRVMTVTDLVREGVPAAPGPAPTSRLYLSQPELDAAIWLGEHADRNDVVASATLCTPPTGIAPNCRGDQFWITGISGLRMLVAGWYYLPTGASTLQGADSIKARIELSRRLVAAPDEVSVTTATERFGVTWVFADRTTGPVSPDLQQFGTVAYDNGTVQIVRLRD